MNRSQPEHRPLSRARVVSCVLVNQCATPGLGSLVARRVVAGMGQLLLALAGFVLIIGWMFELFRRVALQQLGEPVSPDASGWMGRWGLIFFGAGWLWSLVTSISLLRQVKADKPADPKTVPPRLADISGQPSKPA
jgi:hypothetical protein